MPSTSGYRCSSAQVRPALRTEQFLTEMPESFEERLAHVQRFSEEFRLAGF